MRKVSVKLIEEEVYQSFLKANVELPPDIHEALKKALGNEKNDLARFALDQIVTNAKIAKSKGWPICQDTGMAVVFIELGQEVHLVDGDVNDAINKGVRRAYSKGRFRSSVADPLTRENTLDNTPAIIHYEIVKGDKIKISVAPKGFGSENMSRTYMLNPTATQQDIIHYVLETVKKAGGKPCPPIVLGIGIGGTLEKATFLAKKALLRNIDISSENSTVAELEDKILKTVNQSEVGAQGFGGNNTALGVNIETFPTHIAGLPLAINIQCHAARHQTIII